MEYHVARKKVIKDVEILYKKLKGIPGYKTYPTGSNFLLLKVVFGPGATTLQRRLLEEFGVYVRDCSNKVGLDAYHIRVASQGKRKDRKLIEALRKIAK